MSGTQESSAAEKRGRKKVAPQGWGGGGGGGSWGAGLGALAARRAQDLPGSAGTVAPWVPWGWASPRGPRLQQHPSGACGVAKALKP